MRDMSPDLTRLLLTLHIIGACAWLGANLAQVVLSSSVVKASPEVRVWWSGAGERLGKLLYPAAGMVVLITGLALVIGSEDLGGVSFKSTFVSIGFAAVIVGVVLGITVFGPKNRALAAAIQSGDSEAESKLRSVIAGFGLLDTAVVVIAIFTMVWKVGAKVKGVD